MHDDRLQQLIKDAAPDYRVPAEPPIDEMWKRIEAEHFDAGRVATLRTGAWRKWGGMVTGIAATLLVGVGIGRYTASAPAAPLDPFSVAASATLSTPAAAEPLKRATSRYLDDAALLLASLPSEAAGRDARFNTQAVQLLTMTRLLLDSPAAASDARLRDLLEDLELVLVQVARLNAAPRAEELTIITTAMDERDVVPRLRTVAAAMSSDNF